MSEALFAWRARRSGGRITIQAVDETGHETKRSNIDTIELVDGKVIATDKDGETFELRTGKIGALA
jgi:hypothetical protein